MKDRRLRVAVAGLGFGGGFVPIYCRHPDVYAVDIIEPNPEMRQFWIDHLPLAGVWTTLEEALAVDEIDAVHLVTPIPMHARQSIQVLRSGRHCACTVPAATTLEELVELVRAERETGCNYMMMETAVYTRQFLEIDRLNRAGEFGRLQLLRGTHYQDMENWPDYWMGLPPMHYATHAVSPLLALAGCRAREVHCYGSGTMREELVRNYGNPYPCEAALFRLDGHPAALEVTRTLFETAGEYNEGFCVYGSRSTVKWNYEAEADQLPRIRIVPRENLRGSHMETDHLRPPDRRELLPEAIRPFTESGQYDDTNPQKSFICGGGHHGSHPHLVHEFVRSIIEKRPSRIDAATAADWTAAGICAHTSAMRQGEKVEIPDFRQTVPK